jgi:hypothetical protein
MTKSESDEIQEILESLSWEELQETLMHVEMLAAQRQNKIVSEGSDYVQ